VAWEGGPQETRTVYGWPPGAPLVATMLGDWRFAGIAGWTTRIALPPELLWPALALMGACALGAVIIAWVSRWRKRCSGEPPKQEHDLDIFRALFEDGQLSRQELDRIRARLASGEEPEPPKAPQGPPPPKPPGS
jgi:hypothetical protein